MSKTKITVEKLDVKLDIEPQLQSFGPKVVTVIKQKSPKDTQKYANGFTFKILQNILYIYNDGPHRTLTHIIEFGTQKRRAQPHFVPTYNEMSKKYVEHMKRVKMNIK